MQGKKIADRQNWSRLNHWQREDLRNEYRYLRKGLDIPRWQASGIINRMARMACWV